MLFLIVFVMFMVVAFLLARQLDRRRWHRYQIDRDMFFRTHPYTLDCDQQFDVHLTLNQNAQKKLMNELMLKSHEQSILKKALIQREAEQQNQPFIIKVMVHDLIIGYLEIKYAEQLCKSLQETDFMIGRPIETLAEISIFQKNEIHLLCRVKLDLPRNPKLVNNLIKGKKVDLNIESDT